MDTNKSFSFQRVAMVMKRDFFENWKNYLYSMIVLYAAFVCVMVGFMWVGAENPFYGSRHFVSTMSVCFVGNALLANSLFAASIMKPMKTKEGRISYLMLPATLIEKFITRFLTVTFIAFIATLVLFFLADLTRLLVCHVFAYPESYGQLVAFEALSQLLPSMDAMTTSNMLAETQEYSVLGALLCTYAWMLWQHSFFILGGCYWYKKPFLKVVCAMVVCWLLFMLLLGYITGWMGLGIVWWFEKTFFGITVNIWQILGCCFFVSLTFLNWWFAYRLFTRSQVIQPKFRLL